MRGLVALAVAVSGCGGCGKKDAPPALTVAEAAAPVADAGVAPARCAEGQSAPLGGDPEIGGAASREDKVAFGVTRDGDGGRVSQVAIVRVSATPEVAFVWEERALADAPPPAVAWDGADLVVAAYAKKGDLRVLDVARVANGKETARWEYAQPKDESFDFDLAPGLVVWDEDAPNGDGKLRAVLKVDAIPPSGKAQIVTPETSDVDEPRVVPRSGGYWLAWIARKPEPLRDAAPELEGPGERRTHAWLEIVPLDATGKPAGPVKRITDAGSRVEAFDLMTQGDVLTVLVKDDEAPADNAGSRLLVYDGEKTRVLVAEGVGRGIPDLLGGFAAFRDEQDRARLVPLAAAADPRPSPEPALDGARTLADIGGQILAGFPGDPARALRVVPCTGSARKQ